MLNKLNWSDKMKEIGTFIGVPSLAKKKNTFLYSAEIKGRKVERLEKFNIPIRKCQPQVLRPGSSEKLGNHNRANVVCL